MTCERLPVLAGFVLQTESAYNVGSRACGGTLQLPRQTKTVLFVRGDKLRFIPLLAMRTDEGSRLETGGAVGERGLIALGCHYDLLLVDRCRVLRLLGFMLTMKK